MTKVCSTCGVEKALEAFSRDKRRKDGRRARCKACVVERQRAYYEANRDRVLEQKRAYREANPDKTVESHRAYREANRDSVAECKRAWYQANRERHNARVRARERAMEPADAETVEFMKLLRKDPCSYCGRWPEPGERMTIDHIVPVSQGGRNNWVNMTAACQPCNDSKGAKPLLLWLVERAGCRNEDGSRYIAPRSSGPIDEPDQMAAD